MVTGAASSEAALLLIDAARGRAGAVAPARLSAAPPGRPPGRRCWSTRWTSSATSADRFGEVAEQYRAYLKELGVEPACIIPISAREGDNIVGHSAEMPWYQGATCSQALDAFASTEPADRAAAAPAGAGRLQVRPAPHHRRPDRSRAGSQVGDTVVFSPSNKTARIAVDRGLERAARPPARPGPGRASASPSTSRSSSSAARS